MVISSSIEKSGREGPLPQPLFKTILAPTRNVIAIASLISIGTFAVFAITSLFCAFFFVSLLDDLASAADPRRLFRLDWARLVELLRAQLTSFAEWEHHKRKHWVSQLENGGRFHGLLLAVSEYLDSYVHKQRQKPSPTTARSKEK